MSITQPRETPQGPARLGGLPESSTWDLDESRP